MESARPVGKLGIELAHRSVDSPAGCPRSPQHFGDDRPKSLKLLGPAFTEERESDATFWAVTASASGSYFRSYSGMASHQLLYLVKKSVVLVATQAVFQDRTGRSGFINLAPRQ